MGWLPSVGDSHCGVQLAELIDDILAFKARAGGPVPAEWLLYPAGHGEVEAYSQRRKRCREELSTCFRARARQG